MLRKVPIVAHPIGAGDLSSGFACLFRKACRMRLSTAVSESLGPRHIYFTDSATSCFYTILKALQRKEGRKEVILPAYTASTLVAAIKKAGLVPVLCDISLDDFNMDVALLEDIVDKNTLCIVGVHMFGIVAQGLADLKGKFPEAWIVEDCAQGLGSKINENPVGNLGDASFFSLNRGKNLPTYGGGCAATDSDELAESLEKVHEASAAHRSMWTRATIILKVLALSLVVRPYVYGMVHRLISRLKEQPPPGDFEVKRYTSFQTGVAIGLLRRIETVSRKRYENGMRLIEELKDVESIILPQISGNTQPAFNRLPVVFKNPRQRERMEKNLWEAGIETSRMYMRPLHHIFDLGYEKDAFPNATYFAEHLLTVPTHPLLRPADLDRIIGVIRAGTLTLPSPPSP